MAPNNALARKSKKSNTTNNSTSSSNVATTTTKSVSSSILDKGIVENRGHGSKTTVSAIHKDIQLFLNDHNVSILSQQFWYNEIRCFFTVWTFLTRLSGPTLADHHPGYLMRGMIYFPIIGTLIGIWISTFYTFATITLSLSPLLSSSIAIGSSFWLTGCFHEDGLGDTADGFGGGWSSSQILKIMTDTRLGTYGCVVLILYIITKVHLYATLGEPIVTNEQHNTNNTSIQNNRINTITNGIVLSQTISRLIAVYMIKYFNYIDESDGPKTSYYQFMVSAKYLVSYQRLLLSILYSYALTVLLYKSYVFAFVMVVSILIVGHCAGLYSTYIINGIIGDYLGATICLAEIIVLLFITQYDSIVDSTVQLSNLLLYLKNNFISSSSSSSSLTITDIIQYAQSNEQWNAFIQFVVMMLLCIIWSRNVGHPDVLVRDTAIQNTTDDSEIVEKSNDNNNDTDDDDVVIHIGMNSTNSNKNKGDQVQNNVNTTETTIPPESRKNTILFHTIEVQLQNQQLSYMQRYNLVREYIDTLAKPVGSLGIVEEWAAKVSAVQRTLRPNLHYPISSNTLDTNDAIQKYLSSSAAEVVAAAASSSSCYYSRIACCIFCSDHGVAADMANGGENCSAYPQSVSRSILHGIELHGAGVCVLSRANNVHLRVVDVGIIGTTTVQEKYFRTTTVSTNNNTTTSQTICSTFRIEESIHKLANGTKNVCIEPAMTVLECENCMKVGFEAIKKLHEQYNTMVYVLGEIGIGNTTTSSLLLAALLGLDGSNIDQIAELCDGGATLIRTVDTEIISKKVTIVQKALLLHNKKNKDKTQPDLKTDPISLLATFGGAEIAALVGAILYASEIQSLIVIDGFIVTVAAAIASTIYPECTIYMLFASKSTERGYEKAFGIIQQNGIKYLQSTTTSATGDKTATTINDNRILQSKPALDMNLRMGEGTAGLLALPILRNSIDILNNMLTIEDILSTTTTTNSS